VATGISTGRLVVALLLGSTGLLVLGIQPLLYGAYVQSGRVSEAGVGLLASIEIAALSIACAAGVAGLQRWPSWTVAALGGVLLLAGNLLPEAVPLLLSRAVAGAGGGLLVALAAAAIAQRTDVDRSAAAFLLAQAISQYAVLSWFSRSTLVASATQIQQALIIALFISLPMIAWLPKYLGLKNDRAKEAPTVRPSGRGAAALLISGLFVGAAVGIWAYLGLWMDGRGLAANRVAPLLSAALFGQMAGAALAMILNAGGRSSDRAIVAGVVLLLAIGGLLGRGPEGSSGTMLAMLFGAAWMFATPAFTGFLVEIDPTRASLPYAASAQLLGAAVIPALSGQMLATQSLDGVICGMAVLTMVSLVLMAAVRTTGRDAVS
jgi:hypothetical protein